MADQKHILKLIEMYHHTTVMPLLQQLADRLNTIEQAGAGMKFFGTFTRAQRYQKNAVVVYNGSSWVSLTENPEGKPGGSDDWHLLVRRGSDGKDNDRSKS